MPFAVINSQTYISIPEGTNFTCDKVITGTIYTTEQSSALQTNVNINTLDVTTADGYGLITTGFTSTLINFNIGKLTMVASDWIGNGMIGSVTGGSNKTLNINVDLIQFIGTVSSGDDSKGHVIWNNSSCIINAKLGTVNALNATALVGCVSACTIDVDVHKSSTESIIYCVANGSVTVKGGDILGNLGKYANSPTLTIAGYFTAGTPFVNLNTNQSTVATINLDRFGMVTIGGSDIPGYLKNKVIAGDHVTITETDGTLVISSEAGGEDTYQVKMDSSDTADYLPNKIFGQGAIEVNTVSLGANEKQMQIVGTGKIVVDDNDSDFDYLSNKLKAGNHVTIAVVDDAGIRKVEITADGSVTRLEDLEDVDVDVITRAEGQVIVYNDTTDKWENVDSELIYITEPVSEGQVISYDATNGWWTNRTISSVTPAGSSGDIQINNGAGALAASGHSYTNTQDSTYTSWKINRMNFKTPAADTKTTGISRISYLNAAEMMIYNSSGAIEIASSDLPSRTTYGIFSPSYTHIRQMSATWQVQNHNVDDYPSSDIVTGGSIMIFTGSTVTSATVKLTSLVTSADSMYANQTVKLVNHSVASLSFYGFTIASNSTCDFLWLGNGGVGNTTFTLLGRYSNI